MCSRADKLNIAIVCSQKKLLPIFLLKQINIGMLIVITRIGDCTEMRIVLTINCFVNSYMFTVFVCSGVWCAAELV